MWVKSRIRSGSVFIDVVVSDPMYARPTEVIIPVDGYLISFSFENPVRSNNFETNDDSIFEMRKRIMFVKKNQAKKTFFREMAPSISHAIKNNGRLPIGRICWKCGRVTGRLVRAPNTKNTMRCPRCRVYTRN